MLVPSAGSGSPVSLPWLCREVCGKGPGLVRTASWVLQTGATRGVRAAHPPQACQSRSPDPDAVQK